MISIVAVFLFFIYGFLSFEQAQARLYGCSIETLTLRRRVGTMGLLERRDEEQNVLW